MLIILILIYSCIHQLMKVPQLTQYVVLFIFWVVLAQGLGSSVLAILPVLHQARNFTQILNQNLELQILSQNWEAITEQPHKNVSQFGQVQNQIYKILQYSKKFRKLKFSLQEQQLRILAYDVRDLYQKDKIALFFVSAYFIRACELLEKQKLHPLQITKIIKNKIKLLMNITSIQSYRKHKYGTIQVVNKTLNYWKQIEEQVLEMIPKYFDLQPAYKDKQIQNIIFQMVEEAKKKFNFFNSLTSTICREHGAISHHINYKIRERTQISQLKRVKQKLLRDYFKIYGNICLNSFWNIAQKRKIEEEGFDILLSKVYNNIKTVPFVVKDILRAKCMFNHISDIKDAALQIVQIINQLKLQDVNIKLVQFQNRIQKITCDIMLIIQIDSLAYQIQLSLDFDQSLFDISHKMYEISRSKVFSPIVLLFDWFEKIAPEFLYKVGSQLDKLKYENLQEKANLRKQYELLSQFFHLNTYKDLEHVSQDQFSKQIQIQLEKVKQQFIRPFDRQQIQEI